MMTLDEAFGWQKATRSQLDLFSRVGREHWNDFPAESPLWKDDRFKELEAAEIVQQSRFGLEPLGDFAVMILFSVFEATVRDRVLTRARSDREGIGPGLLAGLIDASLRDLRKRAFYHLLDIFKSMDPGLVEEVNQVRRYRNWLAHGRPIDRRPAPIDPETAYRRLRRFLEALPES